MALNAGMLASHDQAQAEAKKYTNNYWLQSDTDKHTGAWSVRIWQRKMIVCACSSRVSRVFSAAGTLLRRVSAVWLRLRALFLSMP
jgi:3-polyprenyl-4-hydroxybenzoate decarboxylase